MFLLTVTITLSQFLIALFYNIGNAGTAMRPLCGVLCAGDGKFVLDGVPRMRERPIIDLVDGLQQVILYQLLNI